MTVISGYFLGHWCLFIEYFLLFFSFLSPGNDQNRAFQARFPLILDATGIRFRAKQQVTFKEIKVAVEEHKNSG